MCVYVCFFSPLFHTVTLIYLLRHVCFNSVCVCNVWLSILLVCVHATYWNKGIWYSHRRPHSHTHALMIETWYNRHNFNTPTSSIHRDHILVFFFIRSVLLRSICVRFYLAFSIDQNLLIDFFPLHLLLIFYLFIRHSILCNTNIHKLIWFAKYANCIRKKWNLAIGCFMIGVVCSCECVYKLNIDLINENWSWCLIFISQLWTGCHTTNTIEKLKLIHMGRHTIPCKFVYTFYHI